MLWDPSKYCGNQGRLVPSEVTRTQEMWSRCVLTLRLQHQQPIPFSPSTHSTGRHFYIVYWLAQLEQWFLRNFLEIWWKLQVDMCINSFSHTFKVCLAHPTSFPKPRTQNPELVCFFTAQYVVASSPWGTWECSTGQPLMPLGMERHTSS